MTARTIFSDKIISEILKLYDDLNSIQYIATKFSINRRQVERILIDNNRKLLTIKEINRIKYPMLSNKEWLEKKYHREGLSHSDIAEIVGCSSQLIINAFKEQGVKSREPNKGRLIKLLGANVEHITTKWLKTEYVDKKRSVRDICSELGVSSGVIERSLEKMGIPIRKAAEQNTRLTKQQRINQAIAANLRTRLWISLRSQKVKAKEISAVDSAGGIPAICTHLESKFQPGMTWDNWGKVWEIDHIKPLTSFNLANPVEQLAACSIDNLQPLWKSENRRKSNKTLEYNRPVTYVVAGLSGSGKSWVCNQLPKDKCNYISFDENERIHHFNLMIEAAKNNLPLVYDPTLHVSQFIKNNICNLDIRLLVIDEDHEVIVDRLLGRGSNEKKILNTLSRQSKIDRLKKSAEFSGTSSEVLQYLLGKI